MNKVPQHKNSSFSERWLCGG